MTNPSAEESFFAVLSGGFPSRDGLSPPGTLVDHCEQVGKSAAGDWKGPYNVYLYCENLFTCILINSTGVCSAC
jgi:hypothetical protein